MLSRMTLDQLLILIAVAEAGSFSAAARKLYRAQSAISQSIQTLEDALDLQLFDRSQKLPQLTDAGKAILADAKRIVDGANALRVRAKSIATIAEPEISLAIEQVFPNNVLLACLDAFRAQYPLVSVTLFAEGLGAPEQSLLEGNARLAIYSPALDGLPGPKYHQPIATATPPPPAYKETHQQATAEDKATGAAAPSPAT